MVEQGIESQFHSVSGLFGLRGFLGQRFLIFDDWINGGDDRSLAASGSNGGETTAAVRARAKADGLSRLKQFSSHRNLRVCP